MKINKFVKKIKYKKKKIPSALRQQVWLKDNGEKFKNKCKINWCSNIISVFNFECGHNIPESKGGLTTIDNLHTICSMCNKSMSDKYSIQEWNKFKKQEVNPSCWKKIINFFFNK
jgi:5-methylcytosine-specific restriction endonuclease McrA